MQDDDSEICPIAFLSRTFSGAELNYDVHDKELLAIYKAFCSWWHYLEGASSQIDVVTDHKNLEYFATTKLLSRRQARWSKYLSAFNMVIRFRPGRLGTKPDALTHCPDLYPSRGKGDYGKVNPHNLKPIFSSEQLSALLRATSLLPAILRGIIAMDLTQLNTELLTLIWLQSLIWQILMTQNTRIGLRMNWVMFISTDISLFRSLVRSDSASYSIITTIVKLGVRTEMSGLKLCEALASTCRLHRSLAGCLEFRSSGRSRRVRSRAEKKLKKTRAS